MRFIVRLVHSAAALIVGITLIVLILEPANLLPAKPSRTVRSFTMLLWARWMLTAMGLHRKTGGSESKGSKLYVANHISWVDILVLMATQNGVFLAKSELASWPLIGWMCKRTGTLFLRRGSAMALGEKILDISGRLSGRESVFCFPEGTTTAGDTVKNFYPGLFQAAIDAGVPVQPIALVYLEKGLPSTSTPFIGTDDFLSHYKRLLRADRITAHVSFLSELDPAKKDRREIARAAHGLIGASIAKSNTFQVESIA